MSEPAFKLELAREIKLPAAALAADCLPDGSRAFAGCLDRGVYSADLQSGAFERIAEHRSYVSGVVCLPKAGQLVTAGYDGILMWHDLATHKTVRLLQAHNFWSWQLAAAPDEKHVASVSGQYLPGGYKYEPAPAEEPSVKVFDAATGELRWAFAHLPPVLSVAFSPDSRFLAAANMMGEIKVWDLSIGELAAEWSTPDFTSWGIIKSHHYIGGIFALAFTPDSDGLLACGMGPMRDPMAGNGRQTWQLFDWRKNPVPKRSEIAEGESGNGLMETLSFHPTQPAFLMAGRLAQGQWNTALFSSAGKLLHSLDTKMRVTDSSFTADGAQLLLAGATGQERKKEGVCPPFGRLKLYTCQTAPASPSA